MNNQEYFPSQPYMKISDPDKTKTRVRDERKCLRMNKTQHLTKVADAQLGFSLIIKKSALK